ncbi:T9SS type A sorting domain-containing protein, partial [Candidatus Latescibacterota bacterium]
SNVVSISYSITDQEKNPVSLHLWWSLNGVDWQTPTIEGNTINLDQNSYNGILLWQSKTDTGEGVAGNTILRVTATDEKNPLGSSAVITSDTSLMIDNESPYFSRAWGFANSDTVYFNFNEPVSDPTVLDPVQYTLSNELTVHSVHSGNESYQYYLILKESQRLPYGNITIELTAVTDGFGNIAEGLTYTFVPEDDNANPEVTIGDISTEVSGDVEVTYQISDAEQDMISLAVSVSIDGGNVWNPATIEGAVSDIGPDNYSGSFIWKSSTDIPNSEVLNVRLRVTAIDSQEGVPAISGIFNVDNNIPPSIELSVADPDSVYSGGVELFYELNDPENDIISLSVSYSLDDGQSFIPASVSGTMTDIDNAHYSGKLVWNTMTDIPDNFGRALVKLIPFDNDEGLADSLFIWIDNYGVCRVAISLPGSEQTGDVTVAYEITDPDNKSVTLTAEYSVDSGQTWNSAVVTGELSGITPDRYMGTFTWKCGIQLDGFEGTAQLRVLPNNGIDGIFGTDTVYVDYNEPSELSVEPVVGEVSGDVTISYSVSDKEQDSVDIIIDYSIDQGKNWYEPESSGSKSNIKADGSTYSIIWHSYDDLKGRDLENVWIKMTAVDPDSSNTVKIENIRLDNNLPPSVVLSVDNPDSIYIDYADVNYTLTDTEQNMLGFETYYSTDSGLNYNPATVTGKTSQIFSGGYSASIRWEIAEDIPDGYGDAVFKLLPSDVDTGTPDSLTIRYNAIGICSVALTLPKEEQNADISVHYVLTDQKNHAINLTAEYSLNQGETWQPAETEGATTQITPENYTGSFIWKAQHDIEGFEGSARLRVTPDNGVAGIPYIGDVIVDYNEPPLITDFMVDPNSVYSGQMKVTFKASDAEDDTLGVILEYSLDDGKIYLPATVSEYITTLPDGILFITWETFNDIGNCYEKKVYLRLTPRDKDPGTPYVAGPFTITNLTGDYNFDLKIAGEDLLYFSEAWKMQDMSKEIGPVSGTPPDVTVEPDSVVDFEDLAVFVWMWNWYTDMVTREKIEVAKPAFRDDSVVSSAHKLNIHPSGDGSFSVWCDSQPDFVHLIIEPIGDNPLDITVRESNYWSEDDNTLFLTRSYTNRSCEIAAARLNDYHLKSSSPNKLMILRIQNNAGDINVIYRLRLHGEESFVEGSTVILEHDLFINPGEFALKQNSPNPFNSFTTIEYSLPVDARVTLKIYNISGQVVTVLRNEKALAGYYSARWNTAGFSSGLYFCTMKADDFTDTKKLLLMK